VGYAGSALKFCDLYESVFIRKLPLPWRERAGVREIKTEAFKILNHYHPHPSLPHREGGKN